LNNTRSAQTETALKEIFFNGFPDVRASFRGMFPLIYNLGSGVQFMAL